MTNGTICRWTFLLYWKTVVNWVISGQAEILCGSTDEKLQSESKMTKVSTSSVRSIDARGCLWRTTTQLKENKHVKKVSGVLLYVQYTIEPRKTFSYLFQLTNFIELILIWIINLLILEKVQKIGTENRDRKLSAI